MTSHKSKDEEKKVTNANYDSLTEDIKLYIFSFLHTQDVMRATSVNKLNNSLIHIESSGKKIWQKRLVVDYSFFPAVPDPQKYYMEFHYNAVTKLCDLSICFLFINRRKKAFIESNFLLPNQYYELNILKKIVNFAEKNEILNIKQYFQTFYILTNKGLFGFGQNEMQKLGIDTNGETMNDIVSIFPSESNDRIIDFGCGMYYVAVLTQRRLWLTGQMNQANQYSPSEIWLPNNVIKMVCGPTKMALLLSDNSLVVLDTFYDSGRLKQSKILNFPHWFIEDFCNKKIIDYFFSSRHLLVWCDDGIYIHSADKHRRGQQEDEFIKLTIFNDKKILNVSTAHDYIAIHCRKGLYVTRADLKDRFYPDDANQFTEIDMNQTDMLDIKISTWPYIEIKGIWHKAKIRDDFGAAIPLDNNTFNPNFKPLKLEPLSEAVANVHVYKEIPEPLRIDKQSKCSLF